MGFHVICSGADLLRQLRREPEVLLGAPYAFYVFILATTIDDKVLTWLHKYERPSLRRHIKTTKMRRWGIRRANSARDFVSKALEKGPSILDAIKKGLELFP
jgi:hypothetical protein